MKSFIFGLFGLLIAAALLLIINSQYRSYTAVVETDRWLIELKPLQKEIESNAIKENSLTHAGENITKPQLSDKNVTQFDVLDSGVIVIKGGHEGQLLMLAPFLKNNTVKWSCVVGPESAMPIKCKRYGWLARK